MTSQHPSSLVNKETTAQFVPPPSYGAILRRSCEPQYAAALRIYTVLDSLRNNKRADILRGCRTNAWFVRHEESGEVRVASSSCHLRWCPVCANVRRNYVTHSVADWLGSADHPKLLTLTLKHSQSPLEHQIAHLYAFFRELRRRKDFSDAVTGGVWFFQIKKSKDDGMWHPHIHALITGKYLAHRRIRHMWIQITYGSEIVDIRPIRDPIKVANDAARYATSPGDITHLPPDDAIEMVEALHGKRICGTWGTGKGVSLRPTAQEDKKKWVNVGGWSTVMGCYDSDASARAIVLSWKTGIPLPEGITFARLEKWLDRLGDNSWSEYDFESVFEHQREPP